MSRKPMFAVASTVVSIFATGIVPAAAQDQSAHAQSQIEGVKKQSAPAAPKQPEIETVVVTAERLSEARSGIQTQIGASTYTVTAQAIQNTPGGDNSQLNQVILQMPSVAQDSFGQFHIRGEHNALQYRLDGITLPEGISVFGQTLDPRLADSLELITGALPAEYGLATGGIIDIKSKTGFFDPGGTVSIYGGSHNEIEPSFDYGGSSGSLNYFVSGDYTTDGLGIESPDGSSTPKHDRTTQYHGFAYLEDILDQNSSLTAMLGISDDNFQIPDYSGQTVGLGLTDEGQTTFDSLKLNENQRERTDYGVLSYLRSDGPLDSQISLFGRFSSLFFTPDPVGDLLFNGISQTAYKKDIAYGIQAESAYHLDNHTIRAGVVIEGDKATSDSSSQVLPENCSGAGTVASPYDCSPLPSSDPSYDMPVTVINNGDKSSWTYSFYLQDEWKLFESLTLNYGIRYDTYAAYSSGSQLSPRVNAVWTPFDGTTFHIGYARYFSPPPFELVGSQSLAKFEGTSGITTPALLADTTPIPERADYYDVGVQQIVMEGLRVGFDSYYKLSEDMIDEGQFGAPIILTPFNYAHGRQYGAEFTADYTVDNFSTYANFSLEHAIGKDWITSQFNFTPTDFLYTENNYIHLDHEEHASASAGISYKWEQTLFTSDMIYGTGLRASLPVPAGSVAGCPACTDIPNGTHTPAYVQVNAGIVQDFSFMGVDGLKARVDAINLFDTKYFIRSGSGIGVFAPQYGARRGLFVGLSKSL
jgi:outer membrane receptor protein involved in Fe transport